MSPTLTAASYNASTGLLTLTGKNLTTTAAGYIASHISLKGDGGGTYQLTSGSKVLGSPTSSSVTLLLSAADQLAIDGLMNKNGNLANDGSAYNLSVTAGWDTSTATAGSTTVSVSSANTPSLSTVAYSAATGVFSFTGSQLDNHGNSGGITLSDLSLSVGVTGKYTFNSTDSVSNLSAKGFTITLSAADTASVNALLNGASSAKLSALAGWDSNSGAAITAQTVTVTAPPPVVSAASYNVTTGQLTLSGQYLASTASGYHITDFGLKGNGGVVYQLTSGSVVVGTPTSGSVTLQLSATDQTAVDNLLNKNGTLANDGTAYNLSLTAGWETGAGAVASQAVSASGLDVLYQTLIIKAISKPSSLAADSSGDIFVANPGNSTIDKFSANGTLLAPGRLRWVPTYAGYYSSTNIVSGGVTNTVNAALAQSPDIDSNGNGVANAYDQAPFFTSQQVNFGLTVTNQTPRRALLTWDTVPFATNYVYYATNLVGGNWMLYSKVLSTNVAGPVYPVSISDTNIAKGIRFYKVVVQPWLTYPY